MNLPNFLGGTCFSNLLDDSFPSAPTFGLTGRCHSHLINLRRGPPRNFRNDEPTIQTNHRPSSRKTTQHQNQISQNHTTHSYNLDKTQVTRETHKNPALAFHLANMSGTVKLNMIANRVGERQTPTCRSSSKLLLRDLGEVGVSYR